MRAITNSTIAFRRVSVKSTFLGDRTKTKTYSRVKPSFRPNVLSKMPRSCNLVYDVLRTLDRGNGVIRISQRDLANITCYSQRQVGRTLKRLQGAKIIRLVEKGKGQRKTAWYLRWNSQKSFPQISEALTTREEIEEKNLTKDKLLSSIDSFKNTPKSLQLSARDKRKLSFIARCTCETASPILDLLWQRDSVAGVWLSAIRGLQSLTVDAPPEELLWRARKAISALNGGVTVEKYQAIMLDQPATKQEGVEREVAEIDRRLRGLTKWGCTHGVTSWFVEKRSELTRQRYETERRLPCGICTDGFFKTINEPQPQQARGKRFKLSRFYTAKRQPLQGEALQKRKAAARKALNDL